MAIIVEEERSRFDVVRLLAWVVVLGIMLAAAYYIFFAAPEIVVISPPANFKNIAPLADVTLNPDEVFNGTVYKGLKSSSTTPASAAVGRPNPFIPWTSEASAK